MANETTATGSLQERLGGRYQEILNKRKASGPSVQQAGPSPQGNRFAPEPVQTQETTVAPTAQPSAPVVDAGISTEEKTTTTTTPTPGGEQTTTDTTQDASLNLPSPNAQANMLGLDTQDSKDRRKTVVQGLFDQGMLDAKTAEGILGVPLGEKVTARNLGLIQEDKGGGSFSDAALEGLKSVFSGDVVGEAVASGLVRDIDAPRIREAQQDLQRKLLEKHPEQAELINSLKDPADLIQFPGAVELIADSGLVLLDVLTLGEGKAVTSSVKLAAEQALKKGGKKGFIAFLKQTLPKMIGKEVGAGIGIGGGFGGLQATKEGGDFGDIALSTAAGMAFGAAIPLVGKVASSIFKNRSAAVQKKANDLVGAITQSKDPKAIAKSREAFKTMDLSDVSDFKSLKDAGKGEISGLAKAQDELYKQNTVKKTLDELGQTKTTSTGEVLEKNHLADSLDDLEKIYEGDLENLARIKELRAKAQTEGLHGGEVNAIAREYGSEFKARAFTKTGDLKNSQVGKNFEANRSGLKDASRKMANEDPGLDSAAIKALDEEMSNRFKVVDLAEKMEQAVQNLQNKVVNRTALQKFARFSGKAVNAITGGIPREIFSSLLLKGDAGLKTMNSLQIQENLAKNIKNLGKLEDKLGSGTTGKNIKNSKKFDIEPGKIDNSTTTNPKTVETKIKTDTVKAKPAKKAKAKAPAKTNSESGLVDNTNIESEKVKPWSGEKPGSKSGGIVSLSRPDSKVGIKHKGIDTDGNDFTSTKHAASGNIFVSGPIGTIDSIEVAPDLKGKGIGRKLFLRLEEIAKRDGAKELLATHVESSAIGFWKKMGFEPRGGNEVSRTWIKKIK